MNVDGTSAAGPQGPIRRARRAGVRALTRKLGGAERTRVIVLLAAVLALSSADAKILQALASTGMKPEQLIAFAFQELAGKADKIGQLNISPDLLRELLSPQLARK